MSSITKNQIKLKELDLEEKRLLVGAQRFSQVLGLIGHLISAGTWVGSVWFFMTGLISLGDKPPDSLWGLSQVLSAIEIKAWIGYLAAVIFGVA